MELNGSRPHWPSCDDGSDSNATCSVFRSLRRKRSLCYQMKVATLAVPVATCPSPLFLLPIPFQSPHSIFKMFDTELFINEVSIRPPLWDLKLKDYSNRDLKSKLWIEVARIVLSNWEQMTNEEKNKEGE
ncbi:hypothetical protein J6590_050903 [Homalodisca vitripennis]|nr:hypothetical protein J6590_102436 [Homalodisca vitripennis]KAG8277065.1 hypothetical protein J6590_050903 [Homalodisca vitripennis]